MVKTNVMRLLDAARIVYETGTYEVDENDLSGSHAADLMGVDHDRMYKTLVLKGEKKGYLVCCIPVDEELDLKKAARAAGEKKVEMIHVKDMFDITGHRYEETFPYLYRRNGSAIRHHHGQRRPERRAGHPVPGGFEKLFAGAVCFPCLRGWLIL